MPAQLRCDHCGDVIGVYEPLVIVVEGMPIVTSRAAADDQGAVLGALRAPSYHRGCYERGRAAIAG